MTKEQFDYYNSIKVSVSGKEIRSISVNVYNMLKTLAEQDVNTGSKARLESEFYDNTEYRVYLLNLVDYARKVYKG